MSGRRGLRRALGALSAALLLAACAPSADGGFTNPDLASRVDVDTPELRRAKAEAGVETCPDVGTGASDLPALVLPCLGGGGSVDLSGIEGPAVVSLWASWCVSCPDELPLFQRLSEEAPEELAVVGVDYQDTQPGKAVALLDFTGATFPQVADPGGDLAEHYRVQGLPGILLVDADGTVTFKLRRIDTYAELVDLVAEHAGVEVRTSQRG